MALQHPPDVIYPCAGTDLTSKLGGNNITDHFGRQCKKFEQNYFACLDAYGIEKSYLKCRDYYEDIFECTRRRKQYARAEVIQKEREKQYKEGKIQDRYIKDVDYDYVFNYDV
ncbi:UNVERIFIED_CONTAM: hypothetical protein PYX00_000819 [Menopon gallinae]|uniref:NADH dehydrogenase [ubiquinone] iron-sulfur protein 5 n=1 Tax=Menopon gallinae TaxID=328185 RepID=A0AAW2IAL3_9NEOP